MIWRDLSQKILALAEKFPVLAILGPRQSGKTTLAQTLFSHYKYVSLEDLDVRNFALDDARAFLEQYTHEAGVIFDEIQHVPALMSYIQTHVDKHKKHGFFILTGSQNFLLNEAITQTLAGRVAIFTLLPLSLHELKCAHLIPTSSEQALFNGGYPRIYADNVSPLDWFPNYVQTFIERDIRQIKNVHDVSVFQQFLKLCAGRTGQLLNLTSLGNDCGISSVTAKSWISLLEQSYILFLLRPHYKNFNKRVVQTPKLYFYDAGLACFLLGVDAPQDLVAHYSRGGLFEGFVITELLKSYYNRGRLPQLYFWRDKTGHEVDCIIEKGDKLTALEIKSGKTVVADYFQELNYWKSLAGTKADSSIVVYAGHEDQHRSAGNLYSWRSLADFIT